MVENTSSDSKTFLMDEIPSQMDPIKKDLMEIDLSLSTVIFFLKLSIGLFITKENFFDFINLMNTDYQNKALLLLKT